MANKDIEVRRGSGPASPLDLMPEFDDLVERFFGPRFSSLLGDWPVANRRIVSNIQEKDDCYLLTAEVPGIPKEDIEISVNGNLLTVRAERKEETGSAESEQGYRRHYRSFHQSFALPTTVEADRIEANYENGILEIMLPKVEQAQPKRIEVQSGKGSFLNRLMGKGKGKESSQQQQQSGEVKH